MSEATRFAVHVHRVNLHNPAEPKKWYAHIDAWGPEPRAFEFIHVHVPTNCVTHLNDPCLKNGEPCAQAWIEGSVDPEQITYSNDMRTLEIGTAK